MKALFQWLVAFLKSQWTGKYDDVPSPKVRVKDDMVKLTSTPEGTVIILTGLKPNTIVQTVQDTNSMDPALDAGHKIFWEPVTDVRDLQVGDIIWWEVGKQNVAHKIVAIDNRDSWSCRTRSTRLGAITDTEIIKPENVRYVYRGEIV